MPRYIDADALKELIDGGYDVDFDEVPETKKALLNMIDYQDTADVRENVHGKWINDDVGVQCSECWYGWNYITGVPVEVYEFNYCPNCGARMDERREDE